jgi:hypothetical protein
MEPLYLYTRAGCHLCDDARTILDAVLTERAAAGLPSPDVVERDIDTDEGWHRAYMASIPVIELGEQRLELALSPARIRRLLVDALDAPAPAAPRG